MPALLTHYLCGNKMIKLIEADFVKDHIARYRNVFNLGTQGPDILFYYGAWPWIKSKGIPAIGDRLHEEKTGEFFLEAFKYASSSGEASESLLTAYLCGYICHYVLDCHAHPYIFYKTGFVRNGETYTSKYTCYHRMFETALDVLMLEHEAGKRPQEFKASDQIRVFRQDAVIIGEMYSNALKKVYKENISTELICHAIADMANISAVLRDRTGIKKLLLEGVEKSLGRNPMFSSMILPLKINDGRDYLNLLHKAWNLPWDCLSEHTASFPEMFDAAAKEAAELCTHMLKSLKEGAAMEEAVTLIGNRSFSTGIDCKLETEFICFDCIYEGTKK